ncbi:unnamed protein product [Rhodiola kirilowii]
MVPATAHGDTQLCTQKDRHYSAVACYVDGEIDSATGRRFRGCYRRHQQSSNSWSASSSSPAAGYSSSDLINSQSEKMDDREDIIIKPDNDPPNQPDDDSNWLRLRLGWDDQSSNLQSYPHQSARPDRCRRLELVLLSTKQQQVSNTWPPLPTSAAYMQITPSPEINMTMRPSNYDVANPSINSMALGQMGFNGASDDAADHGGASSCSGGGMRRRRIIRRPQQHAGIWFMLQASQNQVVEPFLPQIPKSYLRIKDGRMTVRLLKKYIGRKLGLKSESEQVEIICRGQELQPNLTLQHVRDNIWCSRRDASLLTLLTVTPSYSSSSSSTTLLPSVIASESHIMILHYARAAAATTITTST